MKTKRSLKGEDGQADADSLFLELVVYMTLNDLPIKPPASDGAVTLKFRRGVQVCVLPIRRNEISA